jgi:hypothetical protein
MAAIIDSGSSMVATRQRPHQLRCVTERRDAPGPAGAIGDTGPAIEMDDRP